MMKNTPVLRIAKGVFRIPFVKKVNAIPDINITALEKSGIVREIRSSAAHMQIAATQKAIESFAPKSKLVETNLIVNTVNGKSVTAI